MTQDDTGQDGLDDLRGDFARMILDEAGKALARDPSLPLSAALVAAVDRQAAEAARISQERIPTADVLAASVLETLRPELIRIARAAASGDTVRLDRPSGGLDMKLVIGIGVAMIAAILLFGAGFMTSRMLPAKAPAEDAAAATLPPDAGTDADGAAVGQEEAESQASPVQAAQPEKKAEAAPAGTRAAQAQAATRPVVRQPAPTSTPRQTLPNPAAANSTSAGTTSAAPPVAPPAPAGR
jgi:hypothetical protein